MARTRKQRLDAAALPTTFPTPAGAVTAARAAARRAAAVPTPSVRRPVEAPVRLGSLVTAADAASHATACATCGGTSATHLQMTLTDGSPVTFVSCHSCETKSWFAADGTALGLADVLGSATKA
jgi:hypothetical protein